MLNIKKYFPYKIFFRSFLSFCFFGFLVSVAYAESCVSVPLNNTWADSYDTSWGCQGQGYPSCQSYWSLSGSDLVIRRGNQMYSGGYNYGATSKVLNVTGILPNTPYKIKADMKVRNIIEMNNTYSPGAAVPNRYESAIYYKLPSQGSTAASQLDQTYVGGSGGFNPVKIFKKNSNTPSCSPWPGGDGSWDNNDSWTSYESPVFTTGASDNRITIGVKNVLASDGCNGETRMVPDTSIRNLLVCNQAVTGTVLNVSTTPVVGAVTVNGVSWGNAPQSRAVTAGSYTVSFGVVAGYATPPNQTVNVPANQTINVTGTYTPSNKPTVTNVYMSPNPYTFLGYMTNIVATVTDPNGGANVQSVYSFVNYQGPNAGQHRGYFGWSNQNFPLWNGNYLGNYLTPCAGGGYAAVHTGYGSEYIGGQGSCSTSVSGNVRTVNFNLAFDFLTPASNNTLSGWAMDAEGNIPDGVWQPFGSFSIYPFPYSDVVITDSTGSTASAVRADGLTPYTLNATGYYYPGANLITNHIIYVEGAGNLLRGYFYWTYSSQGASSIPCSGGGYITPVNGSPWNTSTYFNTLSCTTSLTATFRFTTVRVTLTPAYTTPVNGNQLISTLSASGTGFGDKNGGVFSLLPPGPITTTISGNVGEGATCPASTPLTTSGNTITDTGTPVTTAINSSGNYVLNNVIVQSTNTICASLNAPSGYSYSISCANASGGVSATPIPGTLCASVTGLTASGISLNLGFSKNLLGGWFQSLLGDVYIGNGFSLRVPTNPTAYQTNPYLIDIASAGSGSNFSTGLTSSNGGSIIVEAEDSSSRISNNNLRTGSSAKNLQVSDAAFKFQRTIDFNAGFSGVSEVSSGSCSSFFNGSSRTAGVYKMDTACFSSAMSGGSKSYNFGGGTGVVYVTGSETSTFSNTLVSSNNSRLVLVFADDVTISNTLGSSSISPSTAAHIQATIISNGTVAFTAASPTGTDTSVIVEGSILIYSDSGSIDLLRERGSSNIAYPAELFKFNAKEFVDLTNLELNGTNTGFFINDVRWSSPQ